MSTTRIHDITGWIHSGMWSSLPEYPGAEISELPHPAALPDDYQVYLQKFVIGGQSGTYVENVSHVNRAAPPVVDLPLEQFLRPVVVIDAGDKGAREPVTALDLERAGADIRQGDAVLIRTGWDANWEHPRFVPDSPFIERGAALWLVERGIGLLGSDFPRFDTPDAMQFPWEEFWERVGLIVAPVTNLTGLSGRCGMLLALPLKIRGAVCTPCRAVILR